MFRLFLERMLVGPTGFFTAGVAVKLAGVPHLLFAQLTNLLSDGDGHRMAFDWKGAGSLHPCFKHKNVWKKASGIERPTTISPLNNLGDSRSCCKRSQINLWRFYRSASGFRSDGIAISHTRLLTC